MWPKQVIARIEGGLGNQLFQYAAARSLADRLQCDLALDLRGLAENGDRPFQLDLYRIRATQADAQLLETLPSTRFSTVARIHASISLTFPSIFGFPVFWPRDFSYDSRFDRISRPVFLVGYWQSERYFTWNRTRLLMDLEPVRPLIAENAVLTHIRSTQSVALHIRRGDYVSNVAANKFHGLCDMDYYHRAIMNLKRILTEFEVFVFSDEPEWAKRNLQLDVSTHYIDSHSEGNGFIDLELMRNCKHHIVANSSFSWWGAWLCESVGQHVHAPMQWFADPNTNTSDVVPSRWNRI